MNIGTLDFEVLVRDGQLAGLLSETRRRIQDFTHAVEQGGAGMDSALREFHSTEKAIVKEGAGIGQLFRSVGQSVGIAFSATAAINFAKQVVNVRAEMQALEQSFAVLLGSEDKAVAMLADLKQFEIESPLDTKAVAQGAQMMLAFGVEADKVTETIRRIGDVSMGSTEKFQSLVLSFSQMNSIGHLISNDVRQMATAGFNPLAEMARTTGKSMEELNAQMADGAISAEMVADAFRSATSEGGQFYGMTRKQAEGISGLQAQLEGALREAFNEIGKSQEGIIAGGYKMATSLVENYEKAGRLLVALIAAYGTYRTALLLVTAATKMHVTEQVRSSLLDARGAAIMTTRTVA
ncbi:MAG: tape measure protein, partial [Tannerella sp.]|nr:tape measure protein [Tannerella sp.]